MASYTEHYHLHQWTPEDAFLRTDFNTDLSAIDQALGELDSAVDLCGNCEVIHGSYTGTGEIGDETPNTLTFPVKPELVTISDDSTIGFTIYSSKGLILLQVGSSNYCHASWSKNGKTLSWYAPGNFAADQLNALGRVYQFHVWAMK